MRSWKRIVGPGVASRVSLWICLAVGLGWGSAAQAAADQNVSGFQTWAQKYIATAPSQRAGLEAEGLRLATARRPVFQKLLREDPKQALDLALPPATLELMPATIREQLEHWVSGRASTSLFSAGPLPEKWDNYRELLIHGQVFRAFVYGRRSSQFTFWDNPVYGVGMDNELAVAENPVWIQAEATASDPTWLVDVGGEVCEFGSETELDQYEQAILGCEQVEMEREGKALAGQPSTYRASVQMEYDPAAVSIASNGIYQLARLKDLELDDAQPGMPLLPCQTVYVQIPAGAVATQITATAEETLVGQSVMLLPAQKFVAGTNQPVAFEGPNAAVYGSSEKWPAQVWKGKDTGRVRGLTYVPVKVYPLRYLPASRELYLARKISLVVDCAWPKAKPTMAATDMTDFNRLLEEKGLNRDVPGAMPQMRPLPSSVAYAVAGGGAQGCDYLIIAPEAFRAACEIFAQHRRDHNGFTVEIKTVEEIAAEYRECPDALNNMRGCLRDYVQNRGTKYVLLAGAAPLVGCFQYRADDGWGTETYPSDVGFWNLDGYWFGDLPRPFDNLSFGEDADVLVGRLPFHSMNQLENYFTRMIDYETNPPRDLARKWLLVGNEARWHWFGGERPDGVMRDFHRQFHDPLHSKVSDSETWLRRLFRDCVQAFGWESRGESGEDIRILCDTLTSWDGPQAVAGAEYDLTQENLSDRMSEGWGVVQWMGHSSEHWWTSENKDGFYADHGTMGRPALLVSASGCESGSFDTDATAAERFMSARGTLAYLGYSGLSYAINFYADEFASWLWGGGWYHPEGGPALYSPRRFFTHVFRDRVLTLGLAHSLARMDVFDRSDPGALLIDAYGHTAKKWNLLGDPAMQIIGVKPQVDVSGFSPVQEGDGSREFTISRYGDLNRPLSVHFTLGGTAGPADYEIEPISDYDGLHINGRNDSWIGIPAGGSWCTFRVTPLSDRQVEGDETMEVTLLEQDAYELPSNPSRTNKILDVTPGYLLRMGAVGNHVFSLTQADASEDQSAAGCMRASFRVDRRGVGDKQDALTFYYQLGGTALINADYDGGPLQGGVATIPAGASYVDITPVILNDNLPEPTESIVMRLVPEPDPNPSRQLGGYYSVDPAAQEASIRIVDEDADPTIEWIEPAAGTAVESGSSVVLGVRVYDQEDGVESVSFYLQDGTLLHTLMIEPALRAPGTTIECRYTAVVSLRSHNYRAVVRDRDGREVSSTYRSIEGTNIPEGPGSGILHEKWTGIPGASLNSLLTDPRYPQRPSIRENSLAISDTNGVEYADRWRGFFIAPRTATYRFVLQANDYGELWISPDDNPRHKVRVATAWCTTDCSARRDWPVNRTAPIPMQQGQRYYLEALHKQAGSSLKAGDMGWIQVGVELPGGQLELPVQANRFDPWIVTPGLELSGFRDSIQVGEGGPNQQPIFVQLNTEPTTDVTVNLAYDAAQIQVVPNQLVFPRATWWQARSVAVSAVDDSRAEANPHGANIRLACASADPAYAAVVPTNLPVSIIENDINLPPQAVRAWPKVRQVRTTATNVQVCFEVQASDDGQPGPMIYAWSQRTGFNLQTGVVSKSTTTNALGTFSRTGEYQMVFAANDGMAQTNLDFAILTGAVPGAKPVNFAPVVSAGPDFGMAPNVVTALRGTASDDKLPANPGALAAKWEKISGPGTVIFGNAASPNTTVQTKTLGSYVLRLTVHDGEVKVFDDVVVVVK